MYIRSIASQAGFLVKEVLRKITKAFSQDSLYHNRDSN
jgi:hypothetical protein